MSNKISGVFGVQEHSQKNSPVCRTNMANGKRATRRNGRHKFFLKRKLGDELGHDRLPISPSGLITINKC